MPLWNHCHFVICGRISHRVQCRNKKFAKISAAGHPAISYIYIYFLYFLGALKGPSCGILKILRWHTYLEHRNFAKFCAAGFPTQVYIPIFYIHFGGPQAAQLWHSENSALGAEFHGHCSQATLRLPVGALDSAVLTCDEGSTCALVESLSFSNLRERVQCGNRKFAKISAVSCPAVPYILIFSVFSGSPQGAQLWHSQNSALPYLLRAQKLRKIHRC